MIINGFVRDVFMHLPMEFAVEATKLLGLKTGRKCWMIIKNAETILSVHNLVASIDGTQKT